MLRIRLITVTLWFIVSLAGTLFADVLASNTVTETTQVYGNIAGAISQVDDFRAADGSANAWDHVVLFMRSDYTRSTGTVMSTWGNSNFSVTSLPGATYTIEQGSAGIDLIDIADGSHTVTFSNLIINGNSADDVVLFQGSTGLSINAYGIAFSNCVFTGGDHIFKVNGNSRHYTNIAFYECVVSNASSGIAWLNINVSNVRFHGCTLVDSAKGVELIGAACDVVLSNCLVTNIAGNAFVAESGGENIITGSTFASNGTSGVPAVFLESADNSITRNTYIGEKESDGVYLDNNANNTIVRENSFFGFTNAALFSKGATCVIEENTVYSNKVGVYLYNDVSDTRVVSNHIFTNSVAGIYMDGIANRTGVKVLSNAVYDNATYGVFLEHAPSATIAYNTIRNTTFAVQHVGVDGSALYENSFSNALTNYWRNHDAEQTITIGTNYYGARGGSGFKKFKNLNQNEPTFWALSTIHQPYTRPSLVTGVAIRFDADGNVAISWDNMGADHYIITRGSNEADYSNYTASDVIAWNVTQTAYTDTAFSYPDNVGDFFYYRVTAVDGNGNESWYSDMREAEIRKIVNVTRGTNYNSFNAAVTESSDGDVLSVLVPEFVFSSREDITRGNIVIGKAPSLPLCVLRGDGTFDGLRFMNNVSNVTFHGFTMSNFSRALLVYAANNNTFSNIVITENTSHGIYVQNAAGACYSNVFAGNVVSSNGGYGVHIGQEAHAIVITNNTIVSNEYSGIRVGDGVGNVYGNRIVENTLGWNNQSGGNYDAITFDGNGLQLSNEVVANTLLGEKDVNGVRIEGVVSEWNVIARNHISGFTNAGVYFESPATTLVTNVVTNNGVGIMGYNTPRSSSIVSNFVAENTGDGVRIAFSVVNTNVTLRSNHVINNGGNGVYYEKIQDACFAYNTVTNNAGYGAYFVTPDGVVVDKNNFSNNVTNIGRNYDVSAALVMGTNYWGARGGTALFATFADAELNAESEKVVVWSPSWISGDCVSPELPSNVYAVTNGGASSVRIGWDFADTDGDWQAYRVYRVAGADDNPTNITDAPLIEETADVANTYREDVDGDTAEYYYYVTAVDTDGNESFYVRATYRDATPEITTGPTVTPAIGGTATAFDFSATYRHILGNAADSVTLVVSNVDAQTESTYAMDIASGTPAIGEVRTNEDLTFSSGTYAYYVKATLGGDSGYSSTNTFTVNNAATLSLGGVTNASGTQSGFADTPFTYFVTYTDDEGDAPLSIFVVLTNSEGVSNAYAMNAPTSPDHVAGAVYTYTTTLPYVAGTWGYTFCASDVIRTDVTNGFSGTGDAPSIANSAPTLSALSFTPSEGRKNAPVSLSVTYRDIDGDAPSYVKVFVTNASNNAEVVSGIAMTAGSGTYAAGKEYTYSFTPTEGGDHTVVCVTKDALSSDVVATNTLYVLPDTPPTLTFVRGDVSYVSNMVLLTATVHDPDGDATLTFHYSNESVSNRIATYTVTNGETVTHRFVMTNLSVATYTVWACVEQAGVATNASATLAESELRKVFRANADGALTSVKPVYTVGVSDAVLFTGLPAGAEVSVYTVSGAKVKTLSTATYAGEPVRWAFDGASGAVAPGVYMCVIRSGSARRVVRVMVRR